MFLFQQLTPHFLQTPFQNSYHHMPLATLHPHPFTPGQMVLQTLCSTLIGPNLPSPHKILINCTDHKPGQPSTPIDLDRLRDYLITKKSAQKHHYDKIHNARPLPDLIPKQDDLFLSPGDQTSYLEGTIIDCANTSRSYIIKAQGHRYRCNRQHIKPINTDSPSPLSRPYTHATP